MRACLILSATLCLTLAGCDRGTRSANESANGVAGNDVVSTDQANASANAAQTTGSGESGCDILDDQNWHAEVASKDGQRALVVTGEVTVKTGGYTVSLNPGALEKTAPPSQHFDLTVVPPTGEVTDALETHPVEGSAVPAERRYLAAVIDCGGKEIERITQIDRP